MIVCPQICELGTEINTLSNVDIIVENKPISATVPEFDPVSIQSPTWNGRRNKSITPAAR